jgi:hypothetical protein
MIHLNQAVSWSIHKRTAAPHATHAFLCTYLSKESAKQPASPLSSRHVHITNNDTKQLRTANKCMCAFILSYALS